MITYQEDNHPKHYTNGHSHHEWDHISLHKGTRQCCLLFPFLFAVLYEALTTAIRQNYNIKSIRVKSTMQKWVIPVLFRSKSTVSPLKWHHLGHAIKLSPNCYHGNIKYLGINIFHKLLDLFYFNFKPLLNAINNDLQWWSDQPITLIGIEATIKKSQYDPKLIICSQRYQFNHPSTAVKIH